MPSPLADLLRDLAAVFAGLGLRWYLFGAQAAIVHGAARLTADVDATVDVGTLSPEALGHAMTRGGFDARVADLPAFAILEAQGDTLDTRLVRNVLQQLQEALDRAAEAGRLVRWCLEFQ